ncbi:MAG TPA: hypothetical protein VMB50_16400 [Myxococcales bacterium]|nr:hypothetical protein [Myxococcales bacterium]
MRLWTLALAAAAGCSVSGIVTGNGTSSGGPASTSTTAGLASTGAVAGTGSTASSGTAGGSTGEGRTSAGSGTAAGASSASSSGSAAGGSTGGGATTGGASSTGGSAAGSAAGGSSTGSATGASTGTAGGTTGAMLTVDWSAEQQTIDGFGASDAYVGALTTAQADLFFSTTNGIGLSLMRTGIETTGQPYNGSAEWTNCALAMARGASVWATPWSPPAADKSNDDIDNGGSLCEGAGNPSGCTADGMTDWASVLVSFVSSAFQNGVPLYALSVQNEPDYTASYESCIYSGAQMATFIDVLAPAIQSWAAGTPGATAPLILAPETSSWGDLSGFVSAIAADPVALAATGLFATHQYGGGAGAPPLATAPVTQHFWETEVSTFDAFDPSLTNAVNVDTLIYDALTQGQVNAWHYWWLVNQNTDNEGLIGVSGDGELTKRLFAVGNYARFVRPGWVLLGTEGSLPGGALANAFKNPATGDFAVVVINPSGGDLPISIGLSGAGTSSVAPWITSGTALPAGGTADGSDGNLSLGSQSASIPTSLPLSGGAFSVTVPAGVTTFVGTAS